MSPKLDEERWKRSPCPLSTLGVCDLGPLWGPQLQDPAPLCCVWTAGNASPQEISAERSNSFLGPTPWNDRCSLNRGAKKPLESALVLSHLCKSRSFSPGYSQHCAETVYTQLIRHNRFLPSAVPLPQVVGHYRSTKENTCNVSPQMNMWLLQSINPP